MQKRLIPIVFLIAYSAILIKVMVFKDVPLIRVGGLMLNFGGTAEGHANFVPFKTILPYVLGYKGWIIAGINLVGNIALLVPIGFLTAFIYRNINWKKSLALAIATGFLIEVMQVVLHVGIFDIDDVILNAFGVMIGYGMFLILAKWVRERKYKTILSAAIIVVAVALYGYQKFPVSFERGVRSGQSDLLDTEEGESEDLCGGTGGNGEIVSIGNNSLVMKQNDGDNQTIHLTDETKIRTRAGVDLKVGDRVTLVGGPNPDGSFIAEAVFVCSAPETEEQ